MKKIPCQCIGLKNFFPLLLSLALRLGTFPFRHWNIQFLRQQFCRLAEPDIFNFHEKTEYIAAGLTTKTIKKTFIGRHGERRSFLLVKRATAPIIPTLFLQWDIFRYNRNNIRLCPQLFDKIVGSGIFYHSVLIIRYKLRVSCQE